MKNNKKKINRKLNDGEMGNVAGGSSEIVRNSRSAGKFSSNEKHDVAVSNTKVKSKKSEKMPSPSIITPPPWLK